MEPPGVTCRVCLRGAGEEAGAGEGDGAHKFMSLFEPLGSCPVSELIMSVARVSIAPADGLPGAVCPLCVLELRTAVGFRAKCEESDRALRLATFKLEPIKKEEEETSVEYLEEDACGPIDENKFNDIFKIGATPSLPVQCDDCGGFFKSKCKLRVHWKKEHKQKTFMCLCKRVFKSLWAYDKHVKAPKISCTAVRTSSDIRVEGEGKNRIFHCMHCEYSSQRFIHLRTHVTTHTPGLRPYKCDICQKSFTQRGTLKNHKQNSHGINTLSVPCHVCGKIFPTKIKLYKHVLTHEKPKFKCPICDILLKNKETYKNHMTRHTGVKTKTCEKCGLTFYTKAELANHWRFIHSNINRKMKCAHCDYQTSKKESLAKHVMFHEEGMQVPCVKCGKFYGTAQKLNLHLMRYHKDRKFKCPHCMTLFVSKKYCRRHIKKKHTGMDTQCYPILSIDQL